MPITSVPVEPQRLEPLDRRPDASRALDRAAQLLLGKLLDLRPEDLDSLTPLEALKLSCRVELATQARRQASALSSLADLPAEELDARIASRQARLAMLAAKVSAS